MVFKKRTTIPSTDWKFCKKRHAMLLEVLIAFALVVLCVLPLIYPQVFIYRSEKGFIDAVDLDHAVNLIYAERLQKMYLNEITWSEIEGEKPMPISDEMLRDAGYKGILPYEGQYQFTIKKRRPPPPEDRLYLVELKFTFNKKNLNPGKSEASNKPEDLVYAYLVFIEKRARQVHSADDEEKENKAAPKEGSKVP